MNLYFSTKTGKPIARGKGGVIRSIPLARLLYLTDSIDLDIHDPTGKLYDILELRAVSKDKVRITTYFVYYRIQELSARKKLVDIVQEIKR